MPTACERESSRTPRFAGAGVLAVDQEACDGCLLCVLACALAATGEPDLERAHIRLHRLEGEVFVLLTCNHCETASCAAACPTQACRRDPATGRVEIDDRRCIGCKTCVVACPFGHAHYDEVTRVSAKCDLCGGDPECVRVCAPGALVYVPSSEGSGPRRRRAAAVRASARRR